MVSELPNRVAMSPGWQLFHWIADPLKFQDRCRQQYGDVFTAQLGGLGTYVVIGDPQMIQAIFSQDPKQFDVGRGNKLAEPLLGENSLLLLDGDRHRRERKLLMPPFHGDRVATYAQQICYQATQVVSHWSVGQPFVMRTAMQEISLEVILQIVFGLSEGERYRQIKPLLADWLNLIDSPLRSSVLFFKFLQNDWGAWSPWGRMQRLKRQVYDLLQAEIDARRAQATDSGTDVLSLMLAARDEAGQPMTDAELLDELLTILFAGHETTATTLAWAFYRIYQSPPILATLQQELDGLGAEPDPLAIAQLPYLSALCQEILRMYPVIPLLFPRIAKVPVILDGQTFAAGTTLMPSPYLVHYREDLYPQPREFQPERFLNHTYTPAEYLPFGGGNRRCLGYTLALLELKLVLVTIVSRCHLELAETQPIKAQRRGFTLAPAGGVRMVLRGDRAIA
jgi:cytochrome P450 family 110